MHRKTLMGTVAAVAVAAVTTTSAVAGTAPHKSASASARAAQAPAVTRLSLTPSSPQLAACMPNAKVKITDISTVDQVGFDTFRVKARHLAPNRSFTVFLLQQAGAPFGAAEYIGDITTNAHGDAYNKFNLIVDEAFSSTLDSTGQRVRVDLNQVGMWFADPADDDFCAAAPGIDKVTPFDGDNEAGVQAFNSANTQPLPAP